MRNFLVAVLLLGSWSALKAQRIDTLMHIYNSGYPSEKVFLHLDRSAYNSGDNIWYKAYVTLEGYPSILSKNLYVELVDDKGNILERNTAPINESTASGSFTISGSYKAPFIYVRAYTRYMLNYDSSFLFFKPLRVMSNPMPVPVAKAATVSHMELHWYPEGGDWVVGLESRLAFKAAENGSGYPDSVQGIIVDAKGVKQMTFASVKDGMGIITMTPQKGEKYEAKWKDKAGVQHTTPLPDPLPYGLVLRIDSHDSSKVYSVSGTSPDSSTVMYHLVGTTGGQVFYMANFRLTPGQGISQSFATDQLPSGIVTVTIFNDDWQPVAERISFVDNNEYLFYPAVHPLYIKLDKRAENTMEIDYQDTVKSNCSISITDADLDAPLNSKEENIVSSLLLTSDLRGKVYKPWDYLSNPIDSVRHEVDLVMLTNGWRRYNWDQVVNRKYPPLKYLPDAYMGIEGQVYGIKDMRDMGTLNVISDGGGGHNHFMFAEIDTAGKFHVDNYFVFGQQKLYYQFNKKDLFSAATVQVGNGLYKGDKRLSVTDSMLADVQTPNPQVLKNNKNYLAYADSVIRNTPKVKQLAAIVIQAPKKSPEQILDEKYASGLFTGGDGYSFDVSTDPSASASMNVFQYLQGRVAGLQITTNGAQSSLTWRGGSPGLYLDEMNIDAQGLQNINMTDVAYIKVFRPPFMAFGGSNGGIAVYTKKGGPSSSNNDAVKAMDNTVLYGYTPIKQFSSPDYSQPVAQDTSDFRPTIYWQPYVLFDKSTRHIKLDFYNNDITKKYKVVLQGMTADGRWAYKEMIIDGKQQLGQ